MWISVKDGLPKHCVECAVLMDECPYVGYISFRDRWLVNVPGDEINAKSDPVFDGTHSTIVGRNITHWMPLPDDPASLGQKHGKD